MFGLFVEHGPYVVYKNLTGKNSSGTTLYIIWYLCYHPYTCTEFFFNLKHLSPEFVFELVYRFVSLQLVLGTTRGPQVIQFCTLTIRYVLVIHSQTKKAKN